MKQQQDKTPDNDELKSSLEFTKGPADFFSLFMTNFLGSVGFLIVAIVFFITWIIWNLLSAHPFDKFPFAELEMVVSVFAIILSVTVLINQNRQGRMEKIRQQVEFEVNVRAEHEVTKVLNMMHEIHQHLGLNSKQDKELEKMKETTDVQQIHQTIDDSNGI